MLDILEISKREAFVMQPQLGLTWILGGKYPFIPGKGDLDVHSIVPKSLNLFDEAYFIFSVHRSIWSSRSWFKMLGILKIPYRGDSIPTSI